MRATARFCLIGALLLPASGAIYSGLAQDRAPGNNKSCPAPIKYRIGAVDPRFGVTSEEFRRLVEQASHVWEARQNFFQYDPKATFPINLVYDKRQKFTQAVIAIRAGVSAKMAQADAIKEKLLPVRQTVRDLETAYVERQTDYGRAQDRYNLAVKNSNLHGGATETISQGFANERQSLRAQFALLEAKRQELNRAVDELNALVKKRNALMELANADANAFNDSAPASMQFKEGRYVKEGREEHIDIFQFENTDSLLVILAHELGHALGMKHNANPASIMSPLIHTDRLALTDEDANGLMPGCSLR